MFRPSAAALAIVLSTGSLSAQATSDIVVFSEMGEKFTLVIDGDVKNDTPASRVVATGIKNATPLLLVRFADAGAPPIKQNAWMEPGVEYTIRISTNKKGEHVFRMQGQAPLGTTAAGTPDKPKPGSFTDDTPASAPAGSGTGGSNSTTTTTVTEEATGGSGNNMNVDLGINGMNMTMGFTDGTGTGTTTMKTTTTTTVTQTSTRTVDQAGGRPVEVAETPAPPSERPAYHMAGYNGPVGCGYPMSDTDFADAKKSIEKKGFEDTKMTLAKQIGRDHCFTTAQVKGIMQLFGFEDSKLDFAKFAYDHTFDIGNYYKVNDVFGFESSVDELNQYIQSR